MDGFASDDSLWFPSVPASLPGWAEHELLSRRFSSSVVSSAMSADACSNSSLRGESCCVAAASSSRSSSALLDRSVSISSLSLSICKLLSRRDSTSDSSSFVSLTCFPISTSLSLSAVTDFFSSSFSDVTCCNTTELSSAPVRTSRSFFNLRICLLTRKNVSDTFSTVSTADA